MEDKRQSQIALAKQILIDNGIEEDEDCVVLQALGYAFDVELFPEPEEGSKTVNRR